MRPVPGAASSPPSCAGLACWPGCPAGTWLRPPGSASPPSPGPNADKPFCRGVTAWADATRITGDRRDVLLALAEAAVHEVATFRIRLSSGLAAVQDSVRDLEASARVVRNFQPGIIPGLLQTAEYARRIMALADIGHHGGHAAAGAARPGRQQALHDPDRSFDPADRGGAALPPRTPADVRRPARRPPRRQRTRRAPPSPATWPPSSPWKRSHSGSSRPMPRCTPSPAAASSSTTTPSTSSGPSLTRNSRPGASTAGQPCKPPHHQASPPNRLASAGRCHLRRTARLRSGCGSLPTAGKHLALTKLGAELPF